MATADADVMARMAAHMLGKKSVAPPRRAPPPAHASIPRSMPTPQFTGNGAEAPLARAQPNAPPLVKITPAPAFDAHPTTNTTTPTPISPPTLTERNMNVDSASMGPALKGDPQGLKDMVNNARVAPTPLAEGWNGFATLHNRPAVSNSSTPSFTHAKPSAPPAAPTSTFAPLFSNPSGPPKSPTLTFAPSPAPKPAFLAQPKTDAMAGLTNSLDKTKIAATVTPTPPATREDKAAGLLGRQMADVKNTLTERKTDQPPPHLRKAAANAVAKATPETTVTAAKHVNGVETMSTATATPSHVPAMPAFTFHPTAPVVQTEAKAAVQPTFTFAPSNPITEAKVAAQPTTSTFQSKPTSEKELKATSAAVTLGTKGAPTIETKVKAAAQPMSSPFLSKPTPEKEMKATSAALALGTKGTPTVETNVKTAAQPISSPFLSKPTFEKELKATSAAVTLGTKADPIILDSDKKEKVATAATTNGDTTMTVLAALRKEVAGLAAKVQRLEMDNVELGYQMGQLIQANERRQFLGTASASEPFKIDVTYPNNTVLSIQVTAADTITNLIRRARKEARVAVSDNPGIQVDGVQIGQTMTLGEVGVMKGTTKRVVFCYDGSDDEEL
ncbi:hypothetical protein LTR36_009083 [Oleoguttula mirabilis]|uniref:Ubiquitin-like domain-containing protein n=1 Tax=Oleoguttula mirabilis TaxID=1507867 RepID=A0AAV9J6B6_9PEZI|nr:hypothetical protein LTR36_009083 [Oleoguttula mirabilis]